MNFRIVKLDFLRNKAINIGLLLFIVFSATLTIISTIVAIQTFSSITRLYEVADPPHFIQMHKGDVSDEDLEQFMSADSRVLHYQKVTMIDIFGDQVSITHDGEMTTLSDFRLDIGLIKQNEAKDILLDHQLNRVVIEKGNIGIPSLIHQMYDVEVGDLITITSDQETYDFTVSHIVLDAMMNSPLTSSTRILVSDEDFQLLEEGNVGEYEYLFEVYLVDKGQATAFQTSYENAGLPQNGQAVNYNIIFILSALTDVVTVFVLLVVSVLLILVAFICLRFTILAAIEEEIQEIGTMKAIGLTTKDISSIYLIKYRVLAAVGVWIGYMLSFILSKYFTSHIQSTFGQTSLSLVAFLISMLTATLVYMIIVRYVKHVLKKIKKATVIDTLVKGIGFGKYGKLPKKGVSQSKRSNINVLLGFKEVFYHFRGWTIIFFVMMITTMMILIPANLLNTFESEEFITYMGSSNEDILIEVAPGDQLDARVDLVIQTLNSSNHIDMYYTYKTIKAQTTDIDEQLMNIDLDTGFYAGQGLQYLEGKAPIANDEIALSLLNAESIGKKIGDNIKLTVGMNEYIFKLSGIYQDVTSGGYTAKSSFSFPSVEGNKYTFAIDINDDANPEVIANEWKEHLDSNIKVYPMDIYIAQTLGGVSTQLRSLVLGIFVLSTVLAVMINGLFLRLRLIKDCSEIAILNAIGFSHKDIKKQYIFKVSLVLIIGIVMGLFATLLLGNQIVKLGLSIASIGIKEVKLQVNLWMMIVITPLILFLTSIMITYLGLNQMNRYKIMTMINE